MKNKMIKIVSFEFKQMHRSLTSLFNILVAGGLVMAFSFFQLVHVFGFLDKPVDLILEDIPCGYVNSGGADISDSVLATEGKAYQNEAALKKAVKAQKVYVGISLADNKTEIISTYHLDAHYIAEILPQLVSSQSIGGKSLKMTHLLGEGTLYSRQDAVLYVLLVFMLLMNNTQVLATNIANEKNNRLTEVLMTMVSPKILMFAKVTAALLSSFFTLGLTVLGLACLYGVYALIDANLLSAYLQDSAVNGFTLSYLFVFLTLYFYLYYAIYACCGARVNKSDDLSQSLRSIQFLVYGIFGLSFYAIFKPESALVYWASFLPFTSFAAMPIRLLRLPELPFWEMILSLAIVALLCPLVYRLSADFYAKGSLFYGKDILSYRRKKAKG